jgi:hypothetical protein
MKLIIIDSVNDFFSVEKLFSESTDILVFDQSVMVVLDAKGVKYKVVEDYYTADQYCQDVSSCHKKVESLLSQLDKVCESVADFPYAYSGNALYLLIWFDDLFYFEKLIKTIQNKYEEIYFYATHKPDKTPSNELNFSKLNSYKVNGTISFPTEKSTKRMIQLIYSSIDLIFVKDTPFVKSKIPFAVKKNKFFNRLKRYIDRKFLVKNKNKRGDISLKNKNVYVIQDGYDVLYIKRYLPKFKYLNPVTQLRQDIEIEKPIDMSGVFITDILESFIGSNFFFLGKYITLVIRSYHLEIVGRISSFKEKFECSIQKDSPDFLLFSIGTRDVFDLVCCRVANHYNIPVITFQHGGTNLFQYSLYQKSVEYNQKMEKTLVVQSRKEIDKVRNKETKVLCMGSIKNYEENYNSYINKPTKDIIFCLGPDVNFSFRHLLNGYSTNKKNQQSIDIIATAEDESLSVDIKLHPTGERNSYECYKDIIKNNQHKKIKVLYGSFAEDVSRNYKLIIIDFLASAIVKHILMLKVPVIIYDCDFDKMRVNGDVLSDLGERCYIARNKDELRELFKRYKAGDLPSKWCAGFVDKYIYPVDNGNPGDNIAQYIKNLCQQ